MANTKQTGIPGSSQPPSVSNGGGRPLTLAQLGSIIRTAFPQLRERRMKHQTSWWLDDDPLPAATSRILSVKKDGRLIKWARTALISRDKAYQPFHGDAAALIQRIKKEMKVSAGGGEAVAGGESLHLPVRLFAGSFREASRQVDSSGDGEQAEEVNMDSVAEARRKAGQKAEEIAQAKERERLCLEGRSDLANDVELVSNRPGLGYDIRSFERDGSPRFIEVKNITCGARFYLSIHQWLTSRKSGNYWFYLVSGVGSDEPLVECVAAAALEEKHLEPVEFMVRLSPGEG